MREGRRRRLKSLKIVLDRQGVHDADKKRALNLIKKIKKMLDKPLKVWYNKDTEGKGEGTH